MKKVFVSGSRDQKEITDNILDSLEKIQSNKFKILIGDSDKGVDNEIIDYLRFSPRYDLVKIYTIKTTPRVRVEDSWELQTISVTSTLKPQEKQMVKDRIMADEADWGLAIFKPISINRFGGIQVSSGTLRNTIQMLVSQKPVKFFYVFGEEMLSSNLKNIDDLKNVIETYKNETITNKESDKITSARGANSETNPSNFKYEKIKTKFELLLENELKIYSSEKNDKNNVDEQLQLF